MYFQVTGSNKWPASVTHAIAVSISGKILVIQTNSDEIGGIVWLNGESYAIGSGLQLAPEVKVIQMSPTQFLLTASVDFYVNIDVKTSYIDLYIKCKTSVCASGKGLLGACDTDQANDFKMSDGNMLDQASTNYALTVYNVKHLFLISWKVSDDIFTHILRGHVDREAETCLKVKFSPMESTAAFFFTESELTVDITFQIESLPGNCVTLWSYKNPYGQIFAVLVCDMHISYMVFSTNEHKNMINTLRVQLSTWYKLSVAWTRSDESLSFYLIEDNLSYSNSHTTANIVKNIFVPGGTFMLGMTHLLTYSFDGYIDDFAVWKASLTLNDAIARAFSYISIHEEIELSYIWRFNEGYGFTTQDSSTHKLLFNWQKGNWADIHWKVASYQKEYNWSNNIKEIILSRQSTDDFESCKKIIDTIPEIDSLGESVRYLYRVECLISKALTNDVSRIYDIIIAISERIEFNRSSTRYPLRVMCNKYPGLSNWYGISCNTFCVNGAGDFNQQDNKCLCRSGFYGESCDQQCAYARGKLCGGGICDKHSGECTCSSKRYDPNKGCLTCSQGWIGKDCSSVAANIPSSLLKYTAVCFGQGYCNMFDGQAFNMRTPGEYLLFKKVSLSISVYIRMRPCAGLRTCIQQVWFNLGSDDFTIKVPLTKNRQILMQHNSAEVTIDNFDTYSINAYASITWIDKVTLRLVLGTATIQVSYVASSPYLSINVETGCASNDQTGLLGNCNQNVNDDFVDRSGKIVLYNEISDEIIDKEFSVYFTRPKGLTNHFIYSYPDLPQTEPESMIKGYSLFFNGSGSMSGRVPESAFYYGNYMNVSLEVTMNFLEETGFICGYYIPDSESQFGLYLNKSLLEVYFHGRTFTTAIHLQKKTWYHIVVSFHVESNFFNVFVYSHGMLVFAEDFTLTSIFFPPSGSFFLGDWIIDSPQPYRPFNGFIGALRIWNIYLDSHKAYELAKGADVNKLVGLIMNYQFTEGFGFTTHDSVSNIGMTIAEIEDKVAWIISDKPGQPIGSVKLIITVNQKRIVECENIFSVKSVSSACNGFGTDVLTFYIDACKNDDTYVLAFKAFIDVCRAILNPTTNPVTDLCSDHRADHYELFCGEFCKHGTPTEQGCVCDTGFWSWNCAQECPNRVGVKQLPCHSHGSCDKTSGKCMCFTNFDENSNCKICSEPFSGEFCEKVKLPLPDPPVDESNNGTVRKTCQIFSSLKLKTFNNDVLSIENSEEWYILLPVTQDVPEIKIRTVQCGKKICMKSLQLTFLSETIFVDGTTKKKSERIKLNGGYNLAGLQNFIYMPKSNNAFILKRKKGMLNHDFRLRISFTRKGYMSLILKLDCSSCTKNTLCKPDVLFLNNYKPDNPSTFSHIVVAEINHTLPGFAIEPNSTAYYSLTFSSGGISDDGDNLHRTYISRYPATGDKFTVISSNILTNVFSPNERNVIEFSMKQTHESSGGVFQYVGESTFTLYLEKGRIKVQAGSHIVDTYLHLKVDTWCDIKMSYDDVGLIITLVVTCPGADNVKVAQTSIFQIPSHCFLDGGRIVIGKPLGTFNSTLGIASDGSFTGEIEDLKIFKGDQKDPVVELNFNEGNGRILNDKSGQGNDLTLHDPYDKGSVKFTISTKNADKIKTEISSEFENEIMYQKAKERCSQLFSKQEIEQICSGLGNASKDLYLGSCLDEIAEQDGDGFDSLQDYTNLCYEQLVENDDDEDSQAALKDPGRFLCQENFVNAGYVGKNCEIECVHADPNGDSLACLCASGFWGAKCELECPGSSDLPCANHGICDSSSGVCTCSLNRQGIDCNECKTHWYGSDCEVLIHDTLFTSDKFTASVTSNSFLKTFDGALLQINNKDMPMSLYSDGTMHIEAERGPTELYKSSLKALALNIDGQSVVIYPQNTGTVKFNGQIIYLGYLQLPLGYIIKKLSGTEILITGPNDFELKCTFLKDDGMQVGMSVGKTGCKKATGVFGKCSISDSSVCNNSNLTCIIAEIGIAQALKTYNVGKEAIRKYFTSLSKPFPKTIFANNGETQQTSGTALEISKGGYVSLPVFDIDILGDIAIKMSFEIRIKFKTNHPCTVLSVASEKATFGIIIQHHMYFIQYGSLKYETNIAVVLEEWTSLGIAVNVTSGRVLFHEIHETGYGQYKVLNISDALVKYGSFIVVGSTTMLGKWQNITTQVKTVGPDLPDLTPMLIFDRILVYKDFKTINDFVDLFVQNIYKSSSLTESDDVSSATYRLTFRLIIGINFDAGAGHVIYDFVHGNIGYVGLTGEYKWVLGDPPITHFSIPVQKSIDNVPGVLSDSNATALCTKVKQNLQGKCKNLKELNDFYFIVCVSDVIQTKDQDNGIDSSLAVADECSRQTLSSDQPLDNLCNIFGSRHYPVAAGENCKQKCIHGKFDNGNCVCESGYFGVQCDAECPGGHHSPCSGHGVCDTATGKCNCTYEWSGDDACNSCHKDWSGTNCDLFNTDPTVGDIDIGNDDDHKYDNVDANSSKPSVIDDGIGMKCKVKGRNGHMTMFNTKGKKLKMTFSNAVLLELSNLRLLVRDVLIQIIFIYFYILNKEIIPEP